MQKYCGVGAGRRVTGKDEGEASRELKSSSSCAILGRSKKGGGDRGGRGVAEGLRRLS